MILIGQYDSPFVRRVAIALTLYRIDFDHEPLSVFSDGDQIRALNPLMRVPTLVLDDGYVLTDSHMMLDYLDTLVAAPMFPRNEPDRHRVLHVAALACGLAEKAVSLFYERRLHVESSALWETRCETQMAAVLTMLEAARVKQTTPYWFGSTISHADIALACALRFVSEAHPGFLLQTPCPALARFAAALERLPVFLAINQPFAAPA